MQKVESDEFSNENFIVSCVFKSIYFLLHILDFTVKLQFQNNQLASRFKEKKKKLTMLACSSINVAVYCNIIELFLIYKILEMVSQSIYSRRVSETRQL